MLPWRGLFHNPPPVLNKETVMPRFPCAAPAALALLLAFAPTAFAQDANLARNLAATCANCHGTNGQARGEMKPLAGRPAAATITLMAEFKSGNLPATIMHQVAKGYTDEQVKLIANYLAAQQPKK
jgi:cytochrome subunit of sulfide dehydrogenase